MFSIGLRANIRVIVQLRAGPRACFRLLLFLYFRHPSISDEKNNTNNYHKCVWGEIARIRHFLIKCAFREKCIFTDNDYIKVKLSVLKLLCCLIVFGTCDTLYFDYLMNTKLKRTAFI